MISLERGNNWIFNYTLVFQERQSGNYHNLDLVGQYIQYFPLTMKITFLNILMAEEFEMEDPTILWKNMLMRTEVTRNTLDF